MHGQSECHPLFLSCLFVAPCHNKVHPVRRIAEGEWTDGDITDPLSSMFTFLMEKRDRKLIQQWGIWLTKRDPERALKVSTCMRSRNRHLDLSCASLAPDVSRNEQTSRETRGRSPYASAGGGCQSRCWGSVLRISCIAKTKFGE